MATFFNLITHLLIIGGFGILIYFTYSIIKDEYENHKFEGLVLIATIVFATFVYFASLAFKLSIPNLLFDSLEQSDTFSFKVVLGSIFTTAIGGLLAWYITGRLEKNTTFGLRIVILFLTLMLVLFGDVYVTSFRISNEGGFNTALLPNVTFVIGILGYVIFNYNPKKND